MVFKECINRISNNLQQPLPGNKAHAKLMPDIELKNLYSNPLHNSILSSVLILLFPIDNVPHIVLIKRAEYKGIHSNQIGLPGGKMEKSDKNLQETALRETFEEIGVNANKIIILGQLSKLYIPPSNYLVYPFVGYTKTIEPFVKQDKEVAAIIVADINKFCDKNIYQMQIQNHSGTFTAPYYKVNDNNVWGATAMILCEFAQIINIS